MTVATASQASAGATDAPTMAFIDLDAQRRRLGDRVDRAIARVLDHGQYIMGPEVGELEKGLATFAGVRHAVSCASGTDALMLVLMAWGIGPGDAVLMPTQTFASTAEVVAVLGACPVFCEVREGTATLDPDALDAGLEAARAAGLTPRAVIPVDLYGQTADYRRIVPWARANGLKVMADAAQSFGASLDGKRTGGFGDVTATSFFPAKPLGCYGDGGAILTDDEELAGIVRSLRVHGKGGHKYDNVRIGLNSRLDTIQAAILIEKLAIFAEELDAREEIARRYTENLPGFVRPISLIEGARSAWALYTVWIEGGPERRAALKARLDEAGIPNGVYYPVPLHLQTAYKAYPRATGGLAVSERLSECVLSLPMHPYLTPEDQDRVLHAIASAP